MEPWNPIYKTTPPSPQQGKYYVGWSILGPHSPMITLQRYDNLFLYATCLLTFFPLSLLWSAYEISAKEYTPTHPNIFFKHIYNSWNKY